jgi:hypothetical protein
MPTDKSIGSGRTPIHIESFVAEAAALVCVPEAVVLKVMSMSTEAEDTVRTNSYVFLCCSGDVCNFVYRSLHRFRLRCSSFAVSLCSCLHLASGSLGCMCCSVSCVARVDTLPAIFLWPQVLTCQCHSPYGDRHSTADLFLLD